jgi:hypothetical protein
VRWIKVTGRAIPRSHGHVRGWNISRTGTRACPCEMVSDLGVFAKTMPGSIGRMAAVRALQCDRVVLEPVGRFLHSQKNGPVPSTAPGEPQNDPANTPTELQSSMRRWRRWISMTGSERFYPGIQRSDRSVGEGSRFGLH